MLISRRGLPKIKVSLKLEEPSEKILYYIKEVRLHAHTKEHPDAGYTNPPCIHRKTCKIVCLCDEQCGIVCKLCRKPDMQCINICPGYETAECEKLKKPPYVCNGCVKKRIVLCQENFIHQNMHMMNIEAY